MATVGPEREGELFTRLYLERGLPARDNPFFRNRVAAFLSGNHYGDFANLASYVRQESGLVIEYTFAPGSGGFYNFNKFFSETKIEYVLAAITLIWRYLVAKYPEFRNKGPGLSGYYTDTPKTNAWKQFVERAMREENMAYTLDPKCGVYFYVDDEFERNRVSSLMCLEAPRYAGARAAFEDSYKHLDSQPADTNAAIRSAFEAVEVVARLIVPETKNLNKRLVENKLKPLAVAPAGDTHEAESMAKIFDGIASWVNALHYYRHGQGVERAVAPTWALTVHSIASAAAIIR